MRGCLCGDYGRLPTCSKFAAKRAYFTVADFSGPLHWERNLCGRPVCNAGGLLTKAGFRPNCWPYALGLGLGYPWMLPTT